MSDDLARKIYEWFINDQIPRKWISAGWVKKWVNRAIRKIFL
jgi:hypothetical protein